MPMGSAQKFKRHSSGTFSGVKVATRGTETASAPERRNHNVRAVFTKKSIALFVVTKMNHFIHIFNNSITNLNIRIKELIKMVRKNVL